MLELLTTYTEWIMHLTDKDGNVYGWGGLEIIGPDGKPKVIDQGLTSVGLSMPSAFTVSNSPLTSNGTIGVTGAGTNLEYIDGTGALRTFPSLSGYVTAVTASAPLSSSGGTTPNITISQASGSTNGYLSAADWTTFNSKQPAGSYITGLSGEASGSGPGIASVTLNNASVTAKILTGVNITGGSINASDSILTAFGKLQNQINGLIGSSVYQGTWNAATNTPALTSGFGTRGYYYIVNVAGTTNLDGITDWFVGDWVIFDGTAWQQVDNTDSVTSVNGQTGAVSLTTDNIPEGAVNQYFTNLRARQALSLTTSGSSGAATYNNGTGVFNIPNYTLSGLGGVPSSRTLTINGTTYDLSADRSWNVGTVTSVDMTVPTGFVISGNPIINSGTLALTFNSDYSLPTIASQLEWDTAYDNMIVSASVTGTTTKTLTLNQQDGGTITTSWTDYDTAPVTSVFGRTGAVVAQSGDYSTSLVTEGSNLYYTDARARAAISLTTTGTSGAATYNILTGVLNIPQYQSVITNPVTGTGTANYVSRWTSSSQIGTGVLYDDGSYVGIGTSAPDYKLDIRSNTAQILSSDSSFTAWYIGNSGVGNAQTYYDAINGDFSGLDYGFVGQNNVGYMEYYVGPFSPAPYHVFSSGNVGIGTTSPAEKLHVTGTILTEQSEGRIRFKSTGGIGREYDFIGGNDGLFYFYDRTANVFRYAIDSSGNFSIGATIPNSRLHVETTSSSPFRMVRSGDSSYGFELGAGDAGFYNYGTGNYVWYAKSNGNVGIGTTAPANKLSISSGAFNNGSTVVSVLNTSSTQKSHVVYDTFLIQQDDAPTLRLYETLENLSTTISSDAGLTSFATTGEMGLFVAGSSTAPGWTGLNGIQAVRINISGNIGIGTTSIPGNTTNKVLSIEGLDSANLLITETGGAAAAFTSYGNEAYIGTSTNHPFYMYTNDVERMRITNSGNVGIGTTSPAYKLTVAGRTYVDQLQYNQAIQISGTDLNGWTDAGFYAGSGLGNAPDPYGWYFITVERHSDASWAHQTATSYGAGNTGNRIYSRTKEAGSWTAWKELSYTSNISGTTNYVSKFTSNTTIGNSLIYDNGTNVGIGNTSPSGKLDISGTVITTSTLNSTAGSYAIDHPGINTWKIGVTSTNSSTFHIGNDTGGSFASKLLSITAAGNIGIGNLSPSYKLDVAGAIRSSQYSLITYTGIGHGIYADDGYGSTIFSLTRTASNELRIHGYGDLTFFNNGVTGSEKMRISTSGNVGIGTTTPASLLHIYGSGSTFTRYTNTSSSGHFIDVGANNSGESFVYSYGAYPLLFGTNGSERIRITSAGNVGIGTTAPSYRLDVAGDIHVQSSSTVGTVYFGNSGQNYLSYYNTDSYYRANGNHYFEGNGFYKGIWDANGFVGIGTTAPERKLDIVGTHTTSTFRVFYPDLNVAGQNASVDIWASEPGISYTGSGIGSNVNRQPYYGRINNAFGQAFIRFLEGTMMFHTSTGDALYAERVRITASGNVGIGTSNPTYRLHVQDSANIGTIAIGDSTYPGLLYSNSNTGEFRIDNRSSAGAGYITFYPNGQSGVLGNEAMRITTNGNIGMGTVTPSQKLHVSGNLRVTGAYYDSNNQAGTSGQILSSTGSGTDWVDSPTATATSVAQLLPSATVTYNWVGQVIDGTWVDIFTRANNVLTTGVWIVTMYIYDAGQGGNHYTYRYSGTMTWYQGGTNQTGLPAASEIALHRMGHAANNCILYLRTTEEAASDGGNGKLQINANYSNSSNTTITFTFVKII